MLHKAIDFTQTRRFWRRSETTVKGWATLFSIPHAENAGLLILFINSKQSLDPRLSINKGNIRVARRNFQTVKGISILLN